MYQDMAERLPPLKSIHYFAVAARLLSFSKAAEELNVTHSAISHQIKALEAWLGVKLFRRANRQVILTDAGQIYLKPVLEAFERLGDASRHLKRREQSGPLTVSTTPSLAAKWLVPHLRTFHVEHPDIDVRISATERLTEFEREDVDVAIRSGRGNWTGVTVEKLLEEDFFPVCSPALLQNGPPLREPQDLARHTWLIDYDWPQDMWGRWLEAVGAGGIKPQRTLSFNHSALMLQAATDGIGVALSAGVLVADDLASKRLVKPLKGSVATDLAYYLVGPSGAFERPKVLAFRDWLRREAAETVRQASSG